MTLDEYVETSVRYIPLGKIVDYLTGKLRRDTPEEHVRQRVVRSLVEEYSYRKEQLALDFRIHVFSKGYQQTNYNERCCDNGRSQRR